MFDSKQFNFTELMQRVRHRDEDAARELIRLYETQIRRVIRVRLTDQKLRRQFDSIDICQSVLGNFFTRVALGQFDLETPEQLIKLLATMARNRLSDKVDELHAAKRDVRRNDGKSIEDFTLRCPDATPSQIVGGREMLELVRTKLVPEELLIADYPAEGRSWDDISVLLSVPVDTLRMRLNRALNRIMKQLGLGSSMDL